MSSSMNLPMLRKKIKRSQSVNASFLELEFSDHKMCGRTVVGFFLSINHLATYRSLNKKFFCYLRSLIL